MSIVKETIDTGDDSASCTNNESNFVLVVKIEGVEGLESFAESYVWLSYDFLGCVVQSDLFEPSSFCSPQEDNFCVQGTWSEVIKLFEENELEIYVCSDSCIHGETKLSLLSLLDLNREDLPEDRKRMVNAVVHVDKLESSDDESKQAQRTSVPTLNLSIQLKVLSPSSDHQTGMYNEVIENLQSVPQHIAIGDNYEEMRKGCKSNGHQCVSSDTNSEEEAKVIMELRTKLAKEKEDWMIHKKREEEAFRKHLRTKEDAVRRFLERQVRKNEEEHAKELELCRNKYKHLELRLKQALSEVEAKEREMKRTLDEGQAIYAKKIVEVELEAKRVQSDLQNHSEIKAAKIDGLMDQVKILEKALESANARATKAELELEEMKAGAKEAYKSDKREEIMELHRRLDHEMTAKNNAIQEKEHYRLAAHRLAKLVREERNSKRWSDRNSASVKRDIGHSPQVFQCGDEVALRRIKAELSSLQDTNNKNDDEYN